MNYFMRHVTNVLMESLRMPISSIKENTTMTMGQKLTLAMGLAMTAIIWFVLASV